MIRLPLTAEHRLWPRLSLRPVDDQLRMPEVVKLAPHPDPLERRPRRTGQTDRLQDLAMNGRDFDDAFVAYRQRFLTSDDPESDVPSQGFKSQASAAW